MLLRADTVGKQQRERRGASTDGKGVAVAIPSTPAEWLPVLLGRLEKRLPQIRLDRRYCNGEPDLPEMGRNLRKSWQLFQKKAITDFGGLAASSFTDRMRLIGVRIGDSDDHPALPALRRIMRDNRVIVQVQDAVADAIETGYGYLVVTDGYLMRAKPESFYADPDPMRPWKARASVALGRDTVAKRDFAVVMANGVAQEFSRGISEDSEHLSELSAGQWAPTGRAWGFEGGVPVAIFERPKGQGLVSPHKGAIDRINLGKLQRLVTTAMQAFKQRAIKPGPNGEGLPDEDQDGNSIDWGKILEPAPGAMWDIPVPIDIWESQPTDIRPLLEGEKTDLRDFAAVVGVPVMMLMPEQQSATGAAQIPMQFVLKARGEIDRFKPALDLALVYALRDAGVELGDDTVESLWADPEFVTVTERFAAAVQAKGAGLSERTIKRDILHMSPDQIRQDEADKGADMLAAALLGVTSGSNSAATQRPDPSGAGDTATDS